MKDELWAETMTRCTDIIEHLPYLQNIAKDQRVLELGVRDGHSTVAFLRGGPKKLVSIDVNETKRVAKIRAAYEGPHWSFEKISSLDYDSSKGFDILFIDTLHRYEQCMAELNLHAKHISKYIILHDTVTFGEIDEGTGKKGGLLLAISNLLSTDPSWVIKEHFSNNNGLTVLERTRENSREVATRRAISDESRLCEKR